MRCYAQHGYTHAAHLRRLRRYEQAFLASCLLLAADERPDVHRNLHSAVILRCCMLKQCCIVLCRRLVRLINTHG